MMLNFIVFLNVIYFILFVNFYNDLHIKATNIRRSNDFLTLAETKEEVVNALRKIFQENPRTMQYSREPVIEKKIENTTPVELCYFQGTETTKVMFGYNQLFQTEVIIC